MCLDSYNLLEESKLWMVAMDWKIARPRCWTPPPRVADGRRGPYVLARQQQSTHGIFPERHSTIGDARVAISCYKFYPNTAAVARGPDDRVCNHLPLRRERRARRGVCGLDAPSDLIFGGSPRHCGPAFPRYSFAALRHRRGSDDSS